MTVALARGGVADLDDVMDVMARAFDPRFGEAWTHAQCLGIFGLAGTILTIAREDRHPLGFALGRVIADDGELLLLAVAPDARRSGLATRLIEATAREAAAVGAAALHLEVRDGNPAHALYHQCGFAQVGRRRGYYRFKDGGQADALTLSRPLRDNRA